MELNGYAVGLRGEPSSSPGVSFRSLLPTRSRWGYFIDLCVLRLWWILSMSIRARCFAIPVTLSTR
eukprot:5986648-Pyramimonas_sp.AAC.1